MSIAVSAPDTTVDAARPVSRRLTLAGLLLVITVAAFEAIAVATAMPTTVKALHGLSLYGWTFTAFLLADVVGLVDAGARVDRNGPRGCLVGGLALFGIGLVVDGLATAMPVFLAGRALQGFGAGSLIVAVYVVVAREFPEEQRSRVFAALSGAWVLPALVGPLFAGAVTTTIGWRWVFLGIAPFAALGAVLLLPVLRASGGGTGRRDHRVGTFGALALAAGVGLVQTAGQRLDWTAPVLVVVGCALLAAPLRRFLPAGTLRLKEGLPTVVLLRGVFSVAFFGAEAYLPLTLTRLHHGTPTTVGIPLTLAAVGWAAGSWWQGHVATTPVVLLRRGFALVGLAVGALVALTYAAVSLWFAVPIWAVAGFGMGLGYPTVSVLLLRLSPEQEQGANTAALQVCDVLGGIIGIAAAATLVTAVGHTHLASAMRLADPLLAVTTLVGIGLAARAVRSDVEAQSA